MLLNYCFFSCATEKPQALSPWLSVAGQLIVSDHHILNFPTRLHISDMLCG
jgi:hypothetical protein